MKLNKLEATFFKQVLNAELGVPVHATLEYKGDTFEVILVPELNEDGQFLFKYYNAPEYEPETQFDEEGLGTKTFKDDQILGRHPSLKRAWLTGDPVTLQMRPSCLPISAVRSQELRAAVLYAGRHHKGLVGLERDQVTLEQSPLQRAKFSLVGLPDFVLPNRSVHSTIDLSAQERETLQSLADRLGDNASIDIKPSSRDITLNSGNGWTIRLIRDEQQNRDMVGHTGLIERADAQLFESDELGKVLDVLKHFLAFVVGEYCQPTVIVGYDPQNRPVWGEVGQFSTSPHHVSNWFNNSSTVFLSTALVLLCQIMVGGHEYARGLRSPQGTDAQVPAS